KPFDRWTRTSYSRGVSFSNPADAAGARRGRPTRRPVSGGIGNLPWRRDFMGAGESAVASEGVNSLICIRSERWIRFEIVLPKECFAAINPLSETGHPVYQTESFVQFSRNRSGIVNMGSRLARTFFIGRNNF